MIKVRVVFGAIIGNIFGTRSQKELELVLSFAVGQPMVLHVHGFGLTLDDGVISKTNYSGVITLGGIFGMRPTHLDKGLTKLDHGFGAYEDARNFSFGSRGHDKLDYLGDIEDMANSGKDRSVFGEHDMGTRMAAGFSDIKVVSI